MIKIDKNKEDYMKYMQVAKDIPSVSDHLNLVSCEPNLIKTWMELVSLYITVILIGPLSFFTWFTYRFLINIC